MGESSPGSRSVRTEESVADDAVESADIEEVVEPADTNPESKEILILLAKAGSCVLCVFVKRPRNTSFDSTWFELMVGSVGTFFVGGTV